MAEEPEPEFLPRDEEISLAAAVARGERAALKRLHALFARPIYRFVYYRAGGRADETEEIVQETFLAGIESLHNFRGASSLFTWLCAIARRKAAGARRRGARERIASTLAAADEELARMLDQIDSQELPDEAIERAETEDLVGATMASLPPHYQSLLVAKYVDSLPVEEIARRRRQSGKSVESSLTRAREAFRRTFKLLARGLGGEAHHAG